MVCSIENISYLKNRLILDLVLACNLLFVTLANNKDFYICLEILNTRLVIQKMYKVHGGDVEEE